MSMPIDRVVERYFQEHGQRVLRDWMPNYLYLPIQLEDVPGVPAWARPRLVVEVRVESSTDVVMTVELLSVPSQRAQAVNQLGTELLRRRPCVRLYHQLWAAYAEVYARPTSAANPRVELAFAFDQLLGAITESYAALIVAAYPKAGQTATLLERQVADIVAGEHDKQGA